MNYVRQRPLTIKLGLLENLDLVDKHIMKGVDSLAGFLNVLADAVWDPSDQHNTAHQSTHHSSDTADQSTLHSVHSTSINTTQN